MRPLPADAYRAIVRRALEEDVGSGDVTTLATVAADQRARGVLLVKAPAVIAGLEVALETFRQLEPGIQARFTRRDGDRCDAGVEIGEVIGLARTLLVGE